MIIYKFGRVKTAKWFCCAGLWADLTMRPEDTSALTKLKS